MNHLLSSALKSSTAIGEERETWAPDQGRQTEVGSELSSITRGEMRLRELLDKLEESLRPVLSTDLREDGCKGSERPTAPLAQHLRGVSESIDGFGNRVASLLARLEI